MWSFVAGVVVSSGCWIWAAVHINKGVKARREGREWEVPWWMK